MQTLVTPRNACPVCGTDLPPDVDASCCPACVVKALKPAALGRMGPYELEARLGGGAMGEVYLACHSKTGRMVAIKAPRPASGPESAALAKRFAQECGTLSALDHPGILPIYEVGEARGTPWFAMKLAEGGSLADRREAQLLPREAAILVATVAEAVQYAHERGILHRDIKPGNILLDEHGHPLLGDFGLARQVEAGGFHSFSLAGTPGYTAPEILKGRPPSVAADLYSLGAVLWELLSGKPPHDGRTRAGRVEDAKPFPTGIPQDLETVCAKCLETEPQHRYAAAADLAMDLRSWLADRGVSVRPVSSVEKVRRAIVRNPLVTGLLFLTTLAIAASLAIFLHSSREMLTAERERRLAAEALTAERARTENLSQSDLLLLHGDAGARERTLELMEAEWKKGPDPSLRSRAIRALGMGDLSELRSTSLRPDDLAAATSHPTIAKTSGGRTATRRAAGVGDVVEVTGLPGGAMQVVELPDRVVSLAWNPAGDSLAIATADKEVYIWRTATSTKEFRSGTRESPTLRFAWHPLGHHIACLTEGGGLAVWDLERREDLVLRTFRVATRGPLAWTADGKSLLLQDSSEEWKQCDVTFPEGVRMLCLDAPEGRPGSFPTLSHAADGTVAMSTSAGIRVWDTRIDAPRLQHLAVARNGHEWLGAVFAGNQLYACGWNTGLRAIDNDALNARETVVTPSGSLPHVGSTAMTSSHDGRWVALLHSPSNRFILTSTEDPRRTISLTHQKPSRISLSADGRRAVTASYAARGVTFWELPEAKSVRTLDVPSSVQVALSPDGTRVALAGDDGLRVWPWNQEKPKVEAGLPGKAVCVTWSADGQYLAVVASRSCYVFRSSNGELLMSLQSPSKVLKNETVWAEFAPHGAMLATQLSDGSLVLRDLDVIEAALSAHDMGWKQ